jgi:hypothetical protein
MNTNSREFRTSLGYKNAVLSFGEEIIISK